MGLVNGGRSAGGAMSKLRVDASIIKERADQLRGEAQRMGVLMAGLRELSEAIELEWQSVESSEFSEWYSGTLRPHLVSGQAAVNEFAAAVEGSAEDAGE